MAKVSKVVVPVVVSDLDGVCVEVMRARFEDELNIVLAKHEKEQERLLAMNVLVESLLVQKMKSKKAESEAVLAGKVLNAYNLTNDIERGKHHEDNKKVRWYVSRTLREMVGRGEVVNLNRTKKSLGVYYMKQ